MKPNKSKMHRFKDFLAGMITAIIIFALILPVFAAPIYKTVEIAYNNIKINIDGKEITPKDANGNTIEPFILDGTTYLPVRAIAEALDKDVDWDGNTSTVFIKPKGANTPSVPTTPTATTETKTYEGRLEKTDSIGTYDFNLPYSARVTMSFEHAFIDSRGTYWTIQFVSKNGVEAAFNSYGNVTKTDLTYATYLPAGDYTVRVKCSNYHSNIDYKINIIYERNIGQFEYESNDSMETATPIQFNKSIQGNILSGNDVDFYKLTVTSRKEISLKFTHDFVDNRGNYWEIELISPNNGTLLKKYSVGNVMELVENITLIDPGDYYIKIKYANYHSNVDYTITVTG